MAWWLKLCMLRFSSLALLAWIDLSLVGTTFLKIAQKDCVYLYQFSSLR